MRPKHLACLIGVTGALIACGGASPVGLGGGDDGGTDSGVLPDDAAPDAGMPDNSSGEASPPLDGSPPSDSAEEGPSDGGSDSGDGSGDGADGGQDGVIDCGAMMCRVKAQVCCYVRSTQNEACTTAGLGCDVVGAVPIPCDDAADCVELGLAGDLCCAAVGNAGVSSVGCHTQKECSQPQVVVLCNPNAANPCPLGGTCQTGPALPPGFHGCL